MITSDQAILVIVDVQGKLAQLMADKTSLFENLQRMIKGFNALDLPIILLEQVPDKLGPTISEIGTLLPDLTPIEKSSFSCMGCDDFKAVLESSGRKHVVLVGIEAHICVYQSAAQLLDAGYEVSVISDAVSSRTVENRNIGIQQMNQLGAKISSVEMLLFELLQHAKAPAFRDIATIVK